VTFEPLARQPRDILQYSSLFEQVRRSRDDHELLFAAELRARATVQLDDLGIILARDQQGAGPDCSYRASGIAFCHVRTLPTPPFWPGVHDTLANFLPVKSAPLTLEASANVRATTPQVVELAIDERLIPSEVRLIDIDSAGLAEEAFQLFDGDNHGEALLTRRPRLRAALGSADFHGLGAHALTGIRSIARARRAGYGGGRGSASPPHTATD
jgi:hypothetical protein